MNVKHISLLMILTLMSLISACAPQPKKPPLQSSPYSRTSPPLFGETVGGRELNLPQSATDLSSGTSLDAGGSGMSGDIGTKDGVPPPDRVIYFDFDQSDVKDRARTILEQHAAYLTRNPTIGIRLEGHADERGSREYNLALGQRRADATKGTLNLLGVPENQLSTLSYGEEHPIALGHNERAWQLNRRVEIVYP
jgi:peptidoglycan-associated lipoprotein